MERRQRSREREREHKVLWIGGKENLGGTGVAKTSSSCFIFEKIYKQEKCDL